MTIRPGANSAWRSPRPRSARRLLLIIVAACALFTFATAPTGSASARPAAQPSASQVVVSTDVDQLSLEPFPCWKPIVTVSLQNLGDQPVYADAWIEPTGPVQVSRELISSYLPAGYTAKATVTVWIPKDTEPGTWTIKVHNEQTSSTVTATSQGDDSDGDLARTAVVSASSSHVGMPACNTADGDTNSEIYQQTAWFDSNARVWPDWIAYDFGEPTSVSRVELYMLDSAKYPASGFALSSYDIQAEVDGQWVTVASVRDNVQGQVVTNFTATTATAVRIWCLGANDDFYSRIVETEIYA